MKKLIALSMAVVMLLAVVGCTKDPVVDTTVVDVINVSLASEPDTLDPALNSAVDGATTVAHLFSGLAKWAQDENGKLIIAADSAKELVEGVANEDGTVTYTYTLKDGLKWSNGDEVKASDFTESWKRAASTALGADYGYMFEQVKGYPDELAVEADDAAKTIKVTLNNAVAYWNELLAFPTYYPVHSSNRASEDWATKPETYICNGPYVMESWTHDAVINLKKNENYHDAASVTMEKINLYLTDDANNMLANFKNGDWLLIDDVPTNEIQNLKVQYPDEFVIAGQIGTYYVCWNVNKDLLPESTLTGAEKEAAQAEIRNALGLLYDRNYIVEEIGQAGQAPASSFVAMGMTDADGSEFYKNANKAAGNSFVGYFDTSKEAYEANVAAAMATLKKYYGEELKGIPTLSYLYNEGDAHKAIGEYLQSALSTAGVTMNLETQEWNTFLNTRKNGDYFVARNGWLADYNDPICFLDMWTSGSGNNDVQFGKGAHADLKMYSVDLTPYGGAKVENGTWAETYDVLITMIKSCTNDADRYAMMHLAEDMLMDTGCIVPLYYYTDIYMIDDSVEGFFANPLGYKYFMNATIVKK